MYKAKAILNAREYKKKRAIVINRKEKKTNNLIKLVDT